MDNNKGDLLKNSWITLAASIAFATLLALSGRAGAATMEHTVAYGSIDPVSPLVAANRDQGCRKF